MDTRLNSFFPNPICFEEVEVLRFWDSKFCNLEILTFGNFNKSSLGYTIPITNYSFQPTIDAPHIHNSNDVIALSAKIWWTTKYLKNVVVPHLKILGHGESYEFILLVKYVCVSPWNMISVKFPLPPPFVPLCIYIEIIESCIINSF
jgi:hypothetical protein